MNISDLANLLALERIIVIQKPSGSGIFTKAIVPGKSDDQLVAAFLTALGSFIAEMKHETPKRGKTLSARRMEEIIGHRRFIIFLIESEHVAVAAVLKEEPHDSARLEKRLRSVTKAIEDKFKDELINFQGNLAPFEGISEILNGHLLISLMETQWKIGSNLSLASSINESKDVQLVKSILWEAYQRLSDSEGFYFDELTELCLKKTGVLGYLEVIDALIVLIKNGDLVPLNEEIRLPDLEFVKKHDFMAEEPSNKTMRLDKPSTVASPPPSMESSPLPSASSSIISNNIDKSSPITISSGMEHLKSEFETVQQNAMPQSEPEEITSTSTSDLMRQEAPLIQLLTDESNVEEVHLEPVKTTTSTASTDVGEPEPPRGDIVTSTTEWNSVFEELEYIRQADLPPQLVKDILKRDIIFEQLRTSNLVFNEGEGSLDSLKNILQALGAAFRITSVSENPTGGKVIILRSKKTETAIAVSISKMQDNGSDNFLWIIAKPPKALGEKKNDGK